MIFKRISIIISAILLFLACQQQTQPISIISGDNLIKNPSFEDNGESNSAYWTIHNYPGFQFAKDAPPEGGSWSLSVPSDWIPPSTYVSQTLIPPTGVSDFQLSFWTKNELGGNKVIVRGIFPDTTRTLVAFTAQPAKDWRKFSVTFQLPTPAPDSLRVELWSPPSEIPRIIAQYDLITLQAIQ